MLQCCTGHGWDYEKGSGQLLPPFNGVPPPKNCFKISTKIDPIQTDRHDSSSSDDINQSTFHREGSHNILVRQSRVIESARAKSNLADFSNRDNFSDTADFSNTAGCSNMAARYNIPEKSNMAARYNMADRSNMTARRNMADGSNMAALSHTAMPTAFRNEEQRFINTEGSNCDLLQDQINQHSCSERWRIRRPQENIEHHEVASTSSIRSSYS